MSNAQLMEAAGISRSYASMILKGKRPCPPSVAIKVYRRFGARIGPLQAASDAEIDIFEKLYGVDTAHDADDSEAAEAPSSHSDDPNMTGGRPLA